MGKQLFIARSRVAGVRLGSVEANSLAAAKSVLCMHFGGAIEIRSSADDAQFAIRLGDALAVLSA